MGTHVVDKPLPIDKYTDERKELSKLFAPEENNTIITETLGTVNSEITLMTGGYDRYAELMKKGLIDHEVAHKLLKDHFVKHLKVISCRKVGEELHIFTHAPIGLKKLKRLLALDITEEDKPSHEEIIEAINRHTEKFRQNLAAMESDPDAQKVFAPHLSETEEEKPCKAFSLVPELFRVVSHEPHGESAEKYSRASSTTFSPVSWDNPFEGLLRVVPLNFLHYINKPYSPLWPLFS